MKKKISVILISAMILSLFSAFAVNIGAQVIELPMIPIQGSVVYTQVRLTSDVDDTVHGGATLNFTTEVDKIPSKGLSSAEFIYSYPDSLKFNGDITVSGLPEEWQVSDLSDASGRLSFKVSDTTGSHAVTKAFAIKFSFDVSLNPSTDLYFKLSSVNFKDAKEKDIYAVSVNPSNVSFKADSIVPLFEHLGASLRINNTPALRFAMRVEKDDAYNEVFGSGMYSFSESDSIKFGMLYIPESALIGELRVDTAGATKEIFKKALLDNAGEVVFAYTVENFLGNKTNFVTRPFVIFKAENGEEIYFYSEAKTRSASQVAQAELRSTTDSKKKELLNKFI